jgi:hypothetical protein
MTIFRTRGFSTVSLGTLRQNISLEVSMKSDSGKCPICGGQITREAWVGHVNTAQQAHEHLYKAFCEACQIVVERKIFGKQDTGWFSSSVNEQDIVGELSQEEVTQVEQILARYPNLLTKWKEFIAQKQNTDIVCRVKEKDSPYTGLTIKRGNHLIGRFWVFRNL